MSGLEGLGIVLGVLPLLVSAIEHYENVFRPFHRYKDFAPEVARFQRRLLAQKTIFRSQCQLLLIPLTDKETMTNILNGRPQENLSTSSELGQKLRDHLGQSAEACIATMTEMEEQLQAIQTKSKEFIPAEPTSKKVWRKHFGKKLRFSVSEPQIDRCISKLRELNQDFSALSSQTSKLLSVVKSEESSSEAMPIVKQYQTIQQASAKFYEALEAACSIHKEHQAHIQVIYPSSSKPSQVLEQRNVHFCVGLSRGREEDAMKIHSTPVWFVAKSITEPGSMPQIYSSGSSMEELARLGLGLKRSASPSDTLDSKKKPRAEETRSGIDATVQLGFAEPSPPLLSSCSNSTKLLTKEFPHYQESSDRSISIPNFCIEQNLCVNISKICKRPVSNPDTCFGYLTKSSVTHELYMENQENHAQVSISLTEFVVNMAERHHIDQLDRVPLVERILLAKNLALAVLQFHTTPVLRPSWSGDDFFFYGLKGPNDCSAKREHIPFPYLRVKVDPKELHSVCMHQLSTKVEEKPIRNHYLFRLGVILLELAYEAPLLKISRKPGQNLQTEFEVADYYSRTVAAMLGPRYARIVRKCLGCDFGQDVDLGCEELRIAIHRSVIRELEGLALDFEQKMSLST